MDAALGPPVQKVYFRDVQLFSVTGQIYCSKIFAGQNLVLGDLLLPKLRSFDGFCGVLQKKGLHSDWGVFLPKNNVKTKKRKKRKRLQSINFDGFSGVLQSANQKAVSGLASATHHIVSARKDQLTNKC